MNRKWHIVKILNIPFSYKVIWHVWIDLKLYSMANPKFNGLMRDVMLICFCILIGKLLLHIIDLWLLSSHFRNIFFFFFHTNNLINFSKLLFWRSCHTISTGWSTEKGIFSLKKSIVLQKMACKWNLKRWFVRVTMRHESSLN